MTSNSTLNYGGVVGTLVFTSFTPGSSTLNITGYTNTTTNGSTISGVDGTDDRLIIENLTTAGLNAISFNGTAAAEILLDNGFDEVVPVPEPATVLGGLLSVGLLGWRERRKLMAWLAAGRKLAV